MKIEKSNNPAAVGALILVLALIVGRIAWMLFGHSGSVAAASTISAARTAPRTPPASAAQATPLAVAASASDAERVASPVTPTTTRNPFAVRPAVAVARPDGPPQRRAARPADGDGGPLSLPSLPPLPVRALQDGGGAGAKQTALRHDSEAQSAQRTEVPGQTEPLPTLTLTAIVGGTEPMAVVQTTNPAPVILHVGDPLDGMRVTAIHDQDVVFARGSGFWTLPLQSAGGAAAGAVFVTSVPAAPEPVISGATPEEKTDEQQ